MRKVEEIERQIRELAPAEFAELRNWIAALEADTWDADFESDVRAGRLDALADQALAAHAAGKSTKL